ncbi:hypothetical protein [Pseudomonas indica]|uniref:hypothetical protein n=1 Tax=Pseudomonas indica TaxID=137658 RepID=UPI0023F6EB46|nr:hypothetical protein [Pseudomonas indica]MBU3055851.1 hypothetical protein [Pseudomonas indica]
MLTLHGEMTQADEPDRQPGEPFMTSLDEIRHHRPCRQGWQQLTGVIDHDDRFPASEVLDICGLDAGLWLLRLWTDETDVMAIYRKLAYWQLAPVKSLVVESGPELELVRKGLSAVGLLAEHPGTSKEYRFACEWARRNWQRLGEVAMSANLTAPQRFAAEAVQAALHREVHLRPLLVSGPVLEAARQIGLTGMRGVFTERLRSVFDTGKWPGK